MCSNRTGFPSTNHEPSGRASLSQRPDNRRAKNPLSISVSLYVVKMRSPAWSRIGPFVFSSGALGEASGVEVVDSGSWDFRSSDGVGSVEAVGLSDLRMPKRVAGLPTMMSNSFFFIKEATGIHPKERDTNVFVDKLEDENNHLLRKEIFAGKKSGRKYWFLQPLAAGTQGYCFERTRKQQRLEMDTLAPSITTHLSLQATSTHPCC